MKIEQVINVDQNPTARLEDSNYYFHSENGIPYWVDDHFLEVNSEFADKLYEVTHSLWEKCLIAVQHVIDTNMFGLLGIPEHMIPLIKDSWERSSPSIYSRFDFGYNNDTKTFKMLEINADTPTSLFESGVIQWEWKQHYFPGSIRVDQYNSVHEELLNYWSNFPPYMVGEVLSFTCVRDSMEDLTTVQYIRDCAYQAGLTTEFFYIDEIGWCEEEKCFTTPEGNKITDIFKLYPWEWLCNEEYGKKLSENIEGTNWIEPAWKMILSNKGILPILHLLFPEDPNILKCYFVESTAKENLHSYVKKPLLSREGANVKIVKNGVVVEETGGEYGEEGYIYQELIDLHSENGNSYILGSWVINQQACGMSVRESTTLITNNTSRFVPHVIVD